MLERAKKSIDDAIMYFPESPKKEELKQSLETFLAVVDQYLLAGAEMEVLAMVGGLARGGRVQARLRWTNKREEIARQLGEWASGIRGDARRRTS